MGAPPVEEARFISWLLWIFVVSASILKLLQVEAAALPAQPKGCQVCKGLRRRYGGMSKSFNTVKNSWKKILMMTAE